ncbi:TapB family protein [Gemmata sp.]|uniref:TapB family protein n=1 Tax=Gemmata sp. TaxID=1914242 RepID=UPI003F6F827E
MLRAIVGLALAGLIVVNVSVSAPVPTHLLSKEASLYYPVRPVAKWVYLVDRKGLAGADEVVQGVGTVRQVDGGHLITVSTHRLWKLPVVDKRILVTGGGLTQTDSYSGKLTVPYCLLKVPCKKGDTWENDCSNDLSIQQWVRTVIGTEEVEVPAGKFTAIRVRSVLVSKPRQQGGLCMPGLDISSEEWYAPGVGVVKVDRSGLAPNWVLKSFTP